MSRDDDYYPSEEDDDPEPRALPDFYIESDCFCGVCHIQNSLERPMQWCCCECGEATHTECGDDCEPSGGWDRDYDVNYWVCHNCSKSEEVTA
jgi:hypothetical protein